MLMLQTLVVGLLAIFLSLEGVESKSPNIIILLADDLGYGDLGCYGHPTSSTPNLDRMAQEGMRFHQFYSSAPICSPSRASLMTGRLPVRNGVYTAHSYPLDLAFRVFYPVSPGGLDLDEVTLPQVLQRSNYTSGHIGKWHLGHAQGYLPTQRGFDFFYGLPYSQDEGCPPYPCHSWQKIWSPVPLYRNEEIIEQPVELENLTPRYTEESLKFIENHKDSDNPFFLYMAYDEVHVPLWANEKFVNTTKRGLFGDALAEMDDSIGQILQKLRDTGLDKDTLVFFTSDNGPWVDQGVDGGSAGPLKGQKGETWEGGMREPAIAWWPGTVKENSESFAVASTMDLFVTAADLAGARVPSDRPIDGESIRDLLMGSEDDREDKVFFYYRDSELMAVRKGPLKAHFHTRCGFCKTPGKKHNPPLLFNVEEDPGEENPLKAKDHQEFIDEIQEIVKQHRADLDKGTPQIDSLKWNVQPCCNRKWSFGDKCRCDSDEWWSTDGQEPPPLTFPNFDGAEVF